MRYVLVVVLIIGAMIGCNQSDGMKETQKDSIKENKMESYAPSQPIEFSHSVHAGIEGINCKYCHNSVTESKSAGIPSVNVCMNCHKQIKGEDDEAKDKIQRIYDAAGWDGEKHTADTKPIVWNKVHSLPDSIYLLPDEHSSDSFSHSKHVSVAGLDCKSCHEDLKKNDPTDVPFNKFLCAKCHY